MWGETHYELINNYYMMMKDAALTEEMMCLQRVNENGNSIDFDILNFVRVKDLK